MTPSPMLELLDEELQRLSKSLPPGLWERALIGPAREFLGRPGKQLRARLVDVGWTLAGELHSRAPLGIELAVELIHAGSLIVDDVQDSALARRGRPALHRIVGMPLALNTGGWLYFLPLSLVERASLDAEATVAIQRCMQHAMLVCHEGQALDLALRVTELEQRDVPSVVTETTARKTAALTEMAAAVGAIAAGGSAARVQGLSDFGHDIGVALQMFDDLGALLSTQRADKSAEDLCGGRPTWPWAWAAQQCSVREYQELLREEREVMAGASHESLARRLAESVRHVGVARARGRLCLAFGRLRATCTSSPALEKVEREFHGLAESYGV